MLNLGKKKKLTTSTGGKMELNGIAKIFPDRSGKGEVVAVDHISLEIEKGEFVTLLGPSGCGKTTTLRLIAGFETLSRGKILLDGEDISNQPPNKRDMALVFQNYALFPHMSVYDNVAYGLQTRGLGRADIRERVMDSLTLMGLEGLEDRRPNQLSGGQQQRVALARSLVMEPRVMLFDEPLSNLDAKLRVQMRSEIHRLQRRLNVTSIYVTHDQIEAMALSDRVVVMNGGRIEQQGSPESIYRSPATRFVADFIGRANFIDTRIESAVDGRVTVTLLGRIVETKAPHGQFSQQTPIIAMIRPEALHLRQDAALPQVRVEQAMYLGTEIEYIVSLDNKQYTVVETDLHITEMFEEGSFVGLDFVEAAVHLLPT